MTHGESALAAIRGPSVPVPLQDIQVLKVGEAAPAAVQFRALGPVEAVVGGSLVDLGAPKQRTLLALLVSRVGQAVPIDVMLEELWAGHPPPSAMTSLQAYVANLRRVLEPDRAPRTAPTVLRTRGQGYLLDSRFAEVDVQRFGERAMAGWRAWDQGDPNQALHEFEAGLALWRGQAYAEVRHAAHVVPEAARLEELRLSVIEGRCAALLAVGAHEVAAAELEAFVKAHPLHEYGCELLSLALYRAGRQADALAVLRTNQKRLAEELGIDPRPALQNLEREILNHAPELDWRPVAAIAPRARAGASAPPPGPAANSEVFVGREAPLRRLTEVLAVAVGGRGQVVTVSGEPGIGKSSLLRRFAGLTDVPVLWGSCPDHVATPPLWPWQQLLRSVGAHCPAPPMPRPVAELLDGDAPRPAGVGAVTLRRFEAIVHYLVAVSGGTPLVLVLDNLHRADPGSLWLLAHLAESVPSSRLLVAASYSSYEAAPLAEASAALARAETTRLELEGFGGTDIQALARAMLHREISRSAAEELRERTEGNLFFLRELIKLAADEGRLDQPRGVPVPVPVREVVLRRVGRLPRAAAELLLVASMAGRHFSVDVVADAASVEIGAALEAADAAVAAGLIVEDELRLGWFRFTHLLTVEVLREKVGRLRRAHLQRRLGMAAAGVWTGSLVRAVEGAQYWPLDE